MLSVASRISIRGGMGMKDSHIKEGTFKVTTPKTIKARKKYFSFSGFPAKKFNDAGGQLLFYFLFFVGAWSITNHAHLPPTL